MWPFRQKTPDLPPIPQTRTDYPYGLFVCTEAGFFLIREKGRYRIPTIRVMASWSAPSVSSSEAAVKHLPILGKIGFRDGTIIQDFSNQKTYLISRNKRRQIMSPDVFDKFLLNKELLVVVSHEEANLHEDGEVLS
ncbi:hypothetical protein SEA_ANNADREAMY_43 [Streptomyces phage Annadreamy]|uniref:Uncharacterized protein n=2 Tax=Annadreamyvirus annadreamy TaxID=2846392 RepID=A0A345GT92_9CAUD|nr:hypothetical protein HWB75_gp203 [Streptomyces phage Annadreamy]AXG66164.1 hypothetical protein SEA_ANNADREAMY_43 [Streptomyces phage Annadreamy]QGH79376.1 hypothetical protein SEA_LIMPID_43 [Streptomyces phage Limpid]